MACVTSVIWVFPIRQAIARIARASHLVTSAPYWAMTVFAMGVGTDVSISAHQIIQVSQFFDNDSLCSVPSSGFSYKDRQETRPHAHFSIAGAPSASSTGPRTVLATPYAGNFWEVRDGPKPAKSPLPKPRINPAMTHCAFPPTISSACCAIRGDQNYATAVAPMLRSSSQPEFGNFVYSSLGMSTTYTPLLNSPSPGAIHNCPTNVSHAHHPLRRQGWYHGGRPATNSLPPDPRSVQYV